MISHSHKTLFVHIPKCAGQSVEHVFLNDLGLTWENRAPLLLRPRTEGEKAPPRLAHLRLEEYISNHYLSKDLFDAYYKFTVVRCPFQRVVSFFNYFGLSPKIHIDTFVKKDLPELLKPTNKMNWFFRPQTDFLMMSNAQIGVDDVFFLENLNKSWHLIEYRSGIPEAHISHLNQSPQSGVVKESLSTSSRKTILDLYKNDFLAFPHYKP